MPIEITMYKCNFCNQAFERRENATQCEFKCVDVKEFVDSVRVGIGRPPASKSCYEATLARFCELVKKHEPSIFENTKLIPETARGIVGRYLCDSGSKLYKAYYVLDCICLKCYRVCEHAINCECAKEEEKYANKNTVVGFEKIKTKIW